MKKMIENIKEKLNKITSIWNSFILEFRFCSNKITSNEDIKTNYFGDILGYFQDTLDIVFETREISNEYTEKFTKTTSLLQAIYIQQDFIEEMLYIFKTGIDKGNLIADELYKTNRDIRNELIGHPISKRKGKLISSALLSYQSGKNEIQYLFYHSENNFKFEVKTHAIADILKRHKELLEKYFDIILLKLKEILDEYQKKLDDLENVICKNDFELTLNLVSLYFEYIYNYDEIYNKEFLVQIYSRKDEHIRYQNLIERFLKDLKAEITERKNYIKQLFEQKEIEKTISLSVEIADFNLVFSNSKKEIVPTQKRNFRYELGKLLTKRNVEDFDFFSEPLMIEYKENKLVISELNHMRENINNVLEYHTSLRLIYEELFPDNTD